MKREDDDPAPGADAIAGLTLRLFPALCRILPLAPSVMGLYGMASYAVAQRTWEVRIHMVLGVNRRTKVRTEQTPRPAFARSAAL